MGNAPTWGRKKVLADDDHGQADLAVKGKLGREEVAVARGALQSLLREGSTYSWRGKKWAGRGLRNEWA